MFNCLSFLAFLEKVVSDLYVTKLTGKNWKHFNKHFFHAGGHVAFASSSSSTTAVSAAVGVDAFAASAAVAYTVDVAVNAAAATVTVVAALMLLHVC